MELDRDLQSRQEARQLVLAAYEAHQELRNLGQQKIDRIVAAISKAGNDNAELLACMACEDTGFGNVPDKTEKNRFASNRVYAAIRNMKTIGILRQDQDARVWDVAVPVGVIAGIVPSTNPTSTVIYKALIALKSGNCIVFSPHPGAARCTQKTAELIAQAAVAAGCPHGAICCIPHPTMDAVRELMGHRHTSLILATGGPAMVRAAYSSGKPAIGVGAGNGPVYIHRSANIKKAVSDIIFSKTFDNGTVCSAEQSVILEDCCAEEVRKEFLEQGAYFLSEDEAAMVATLLLRPDGSINPKVVGKTANEMAQMAGLPNVPQDTKVLIAAETEADPARPYSREKLCPILALFVERDEHACLERACKVLNNEGSGHTFSMHATDEAAVRRFATKIPVSRFLVNTPSTLGGIGATTNLFPALTLGCGAAGGSSTSNNIGPLDLLNIRRVAWDMRESAAAEHTNSNTQFNQ